MRHQRASSGSVTLPPGPAAAHPIGLERSTFGRESFPAAAAQRPTGAGVGDAAGGASGPVCRWQPAGLAFSPAPLAGGVSGISHEGWPRPIRPALRPDPAGCPYTNGRKKGTRRREARPRYQPSMAERNATSLDCAGGFLGAGRSSRWRLLCWWSWRLERLVGAEIGNGSRRAGW